MLKCAEYSVRVNHSIKNFNANLALYNVYVFVLKFTLLNQLHNQHVSLIGILKQIIKLQ